MTNELSPWDQFSRPDNMDETVLSSVPANSCCYTLYNLNLLNDVTLG